VSDILSRVLIRRCLRSVRKATVPYVWHIILGIVFFGVVDGFEKLDPRNVTWITFKDNRQHWIGWQFFASDRWRWPLGANPNYGWEGINSIVYTDSWPILALPLKALQLEVLREGQFFGLAWLCTSVLLFVGCAKVFEILGVSRLQSVVGSALVASTPLFWWLHRWYFAISGGATLIVWAIYAYLRDGRRGGYSVAMWLVLLIGAVGTNMYLCAMLIPIAGASLLRNSFGRRDWWYRILGYTTVTGAALLGSMYLFGYFTMPLASASTGRYGIYSSNLLGLIDMNESSRFFPDVPSMPLQYEPTSVGIGTVLILAFFLVLVPPRRYLSAISRTLRHHWPFWIAVLAMFFFAVSHVVTIGGHTEIIPLPGRVVELFSVFQSSMRFVWPLTVTIVISSVVLVCRYFKFATGLLMFALVLQAADVSHEIRSVANRDDGRESIVAYDSDFWQAVPTPYTRFSFHYAENIRTGWDECSLAAVRTKRIANCAYLSRAPDFGPINAAQDELLLSGTPDSDVIYWVTFSWFVNHEKEIRQLYGGRQHGIAVFDPKSVSSKEFVMFFPYCDRYEDCGFLGDRRITVDEAVSMIG